MTTTAQRGTPLRKKHPRSPITRPGENGFAYRRRFGIILECATEADQQRLYNRLLKQGHAPKVVCV
jgi:hypothetical protein